MTAFALPPLSTSLVSGEVAIGEGVQVFSGVDLTAWAATFLAAVQEMPVPAELRALLVDAIAPRLAPVSAGAEGVPAGEVDRFRAALGEDLGNAYAGIAFCPPAPVLAGQSAAGPPAPASLAEALTWSYRCEVVPARERGDELLLSVLLHGAPALPPHAPTDLTGDPLFEALARFVAAPARTEAMIEEVARALAGWTAPPAGEPGRVEPATWAYRIGFGPAGALRLTRSAGAPWPQIEGFWAPADDGLYRPRKPPPAGTLAFTFAGLPIATMRSAHAAIRGRRTAAPVPEDAAAGPAFVYATPWLGPVAPVTPLTHLSRPLQVGTRAGTLSAALGELLSSLPALRLKVAASYQFIMGRGVTRATVFRTDRDTPADCKAPFADMLIDWHSGMRPSDDGASLHFAVTLLAQADGQAVPLVQLDDIVIPVPPGQPSWWK